MEVGQYLMCALASGGGGGGGRSRISNSSSILGYVSSLDFGLPV